MENYFIVKSKPNKEKKIDNSKELILKKNNNVFLEDFKIHKQYALQLLNIVNKSPQIEKNIMNLYIYGGRGSGKYTLARAYLNEYLDYADTNLRLEIMKTESRELEFFRGDNHCELIIYKYNFNDINMINKFFKEVCWDTNTGFSSRKNIILIKNIELIRKENLYVFKHNIEKYMNNNIFIIISNTYCLNELKGFFCPLRIEYPSNEILKEYSFNVLTELKVPEENRKEDDIQYMIDYCEGNMSILNNSLQYSYLTGSYQKFVDCDEGKFLFIYKLLKNKNMKNLFLIRELLIDLLAENIIPSVILKYILKKILNSKKIKSKKKQKSVDIIVKCDLNDKNGFRSIIHLEYAFIQLINTL